MKEKELLQELGKHARREAAEQQLRFDQRWDRLCAGSLTEEEEQELRDLAAASPEHQQAMEMMQPLSAEARQRIVAALLPAAARPAPSVVPAGHQGRRLAWAWWALPVAATILVAVLLLPAMHSQPSALPGYSLELSGGVQELRGPSRVAAEPMLQPGSRLTLVLRPETAVDRAVAVRCLLQRHDEIRACPWPVEVAATGAARIELELGREAELAPGRWQLVAAVADQQSVPSPEELKILVRSHEPIAYNGLVVLRTSFCVVQEHVSRGS